MPEPKPNPSHDANGLPLCDQDCALYDGKRCSALGFKPDRFCEPALIEIVEKVASLEARVVELERRPGPIEAAVGRYIAAAAGARDAGGVTTIEQAPPEDLLDRITPDGWPIGPDGFTRVSCGTDRSLEYPCPGCGQTAGAKCVRPVKIVPNPDPAPPGCRHTRRDLRLDHGNPKTTCIDCGEDLS